MDAAETYTRGRDLRAREVDGLEARARRIGTLRLLVAAGALALLGTGVWGHVGLGIWVALGVDLAIFAALVVAHARVLEARDRAAAALRFHERGLARLEHAWDRLVVSSDRFAQPDHAFASDLDLFGRGSLMQLVDATETRFGEEQLARLLAAEVSAEWPAPALERQTAVRDLAGRPGFREALATAGGILAEERPDPGPILRWAEGRSGVAAGFAALGFVLPAVLLTLTVADLVVPAFPGKVLGLSVIVVQGLAAWVGVRLEGLLSMASDGARAVGRWRAMLELVEREKFESPLLLRLQARLSEQGRPSSAEIAALDRVVGFTDARRNEVFRFLLGPLVMWDVHCGRALARWRARAGGHVRAWLDVLGEVEALASLGGFAFENPTFAWPELVAEPTLVARQLGHPLLPTSRRIGNDVALPSAGRALVVTGSNMSGKSTLLRAMGLNAVLAAAGAPVCAASLRVGPARVATSMRIADSLEHGVSHFYAELQRLKAIVDRARGDGPPVLFLLDEILHGTNSRERVLGACAVVRELLARGALGAVSTHDLGITALEAELGDRVTNVHFEEQVQGDRMTFDYVLRPGIVQSSNALRLMRAVGIDVVDVA